MVTWSEFNLSGIRTAVFTPDHSAFVAAKAVGLMLSQFADRYDGEMQVPPLPEGIVPELPRVTLQGKEGEWRLMMGPSRFDSFWDLGPRKNDQSLSHLVHECVEPQLQYLEKLQTPVHAFAK